MSYFWAMFWAFLMGAAVGVALTWLYARRIINHVLNGVNKVLDGLPRP